MDGTGVPVVKAETAGRTGKIDGQPAHPREAKLGCVFTQTKGGEQGYPLRDPDSTTYTGAIETAAEFGMWKPGGGAGTVQKGKSMARNGYGISRTSISLAPCKSWISTTAQHCLVG
jgi:hypothetical protein